MGLDCSTFFIYISPCRMHLRVYRRGKAEFSPHYIFKQLKTWRILQPQLGDYPRMCQPRPSLGTWEWVNSKRIIVFINGLMVVLINKLSSQVNHINSYTDPWWKSFLRRYFTGFLQLQHVQDMWIIACMDNQNVNILKMSTFEYQPIHQLSACPYF